MAGGSYHGRNWVKRSSSPSRSKRGAPRAIPWGEILSESPLFTTYGNLFGLKDRRNEWNSWND